MSDAMVSPALVSWHVEGAIAEIVLDHGPLNLVTRPMLRSLGEAIRSVATSDGVRCVIVHGGTARAFCAGSDIREFAHLRADASEHKILFEDMVLRNLARLPMPTIAAIDGHALGGGLELALACDLRVCKAGVSLGLTESRLGGLAGSGSVRLARLIGPARTKQMLFTGETITTDQALAWGAVNEVVVEGHAVDAARRLAAVISERGPLSSRFGKQLVDAAFDQPLDASLVQSTVLQQQIFDSEDLREGMTAFFGKRTPVFTGC
jgi:enoyl-CoA hydratase/carnithine racemase